MRCSICKNEIELKQEFIITKQNQTICDNCFETIEVYAIQDENNTTLSCDELIFIGNTQAYNDKINEHYDSKTSLENEISDLYKIIKMLEEDKKKFISEINILEKELKEYE